MARYFFGIDGTMLVERRSTPRYDYEAGIEVKLAGGGSIRGTTQNISDAGMQVVLPGAIAEGRLVDFACADLAGSAQVVWMRREEASVRIGLRFISLAQAERDALATLLAGLRKERSASAVTRGA